MSRHRVLLTCDVAAEGLGEVICKGFFALSVAELWVLPQPRVDPGRAEGSCLVQGEEDVGCTPHQLALDGAHVGRRTAHLEEIGLDEHLAHGKTAGQSVAD